MVLGLFRRRVPRPRRRVPLTFLLILVISGLLWFAPMLVVNTSLKTTILDKATDGFEGEVSTGYISAGWLSPIVVNDLVAQDAHGEPLLLAATARTKKTLLSLIIDPNNVGVIRIDKPKLQLVLKEQTTNLEEALRPLLDRPATDSGPIDLTLELVDGTVSARDESTGRKWEAEGINVTLAALGKQAQLNAHFEANVTGQDAPAGSVVADIEWQQPNVAKRTGLPNAVPNALPESPEAASATATLPNNGPLGSGTLTAEIRRFDLRVVEAILRRFAPDINLTGGLGGDMRIEWGAQGESVTLEGIAIDQFQLAAPQWLGPDHVALERVNLDGLLTHRENGWKVSDFAVASDVMSLRAAGQGRIAVAPADDWAKALADVWQRGEYQVTGNLDVARLAQLLPQTMRIRESVQLTSGRISGALAASQGGDGHQWRAEITAADLAGTHDGLPIRFDEPVEIAFTARQAGGDTILDRLTCQASFFQLNASGTQQQGTLAAEGDLTQFFKEVSRFVDVGDLGLAGRLQTDIRWQQVAPGEVALQATAEATQFELTRGNQPPWREAQMRIELAATGTQVADAARGLRKATLHVQSAGDVLDVELLQPVAPLSTSTPLPLRAQLQGELRSWRTRIRPWLPAMDMTLDGTVSADLQGSGSSHRVNIDAADIRVQQLNFVGVGLRIQEPEVQLKTEATLNLDDLEFVAAKATYASTSLAFQAENVRVKNSPSQVEISGNAGFRADLARISQWMKDPSRPATDQVSGAAVGQLRLMQQAGLTMADVQAEISDFAYAMRTVATPNSSAPSTALRPSAIPNSGTWNTLWNEPVLNVATVVGYVHADQTVRLDKIEVAGDAVSLGARGKLTDPFGRCYLDIEGQIGYDLDRVTRKLRPQLGNYVQLQGRDAKPFKLRGPLLAAQGPAATANAPAPTSGSILTELMAQGSLAWTSANVQGFAIGPGQIESEMADGVATARTLQVPLAEGTLRLTPRLVMNRSPMVLQLAHGSGAENVRITRDMCQNWLKYVAPLVADATAAEGKFSITLDGASVPLDLPQAADVKGKLVVHQAQIGPGPLAQELLLLANQIRTLAEGKPLGALNSASGTWLNLPDQEIDFQLVDQRVHHDGLQMRVKDVVIRTRGSVGMDQSLAMVAEIPVRDEWLGSSRYLAPLKGQTLRVPIQGTLSKPRLDRSALEQITRQTVTGAASQLIEQEINKGIGRGLEKLFGPQQ